MCEFMEKERAQRLLPSYQASIEQRIDVALQAVVGPVKQYWIHQDWTIPSLADLMNFPAPSVNSVWCKEAGRIPTLRDAVVLPYEQATFDTSQNTVQALRDDLHIAHDDWIHDVHFDLLKLTLGTTPPTIDADPYNVFLPSLVLNCKGCALPVFYPEVLTHRCERKKSELPEDPQLWSKDRFEVNAYTRALMSTMIAYLGLDPEQATIRHLDALDVYLWWTAGPDSVTGRQHRVYYGWRKFVSPSSLPLDCC